MPRTVKTLLQLITDVRDILEEPVAARWSNDKIKDYLNRCQEDFAVLADRLVTDEATLLAGEGTMDYPDDFLMMGELFWTDGIRRHEIKPGSSRAFSDGEDTDTTTGPQYYYPVDGAIQIRPKQVTDTDIIIVYYQDPPEMEKDDDKPYFNHTQDGLIAGAAWMAYRDDNDPRAQLWEQSYSIEKMKWMAIETQNYQSAFRQENNW